MLTLAEYPKFPKITYELGRRKIITWKIQEQVLDKVKEISYHKNPKVWFGMELLATYTALRPDDLRRVYENSLDASGFLTIHNPTKRKNKFKVVRLHPENVEIWMELSKAYPAMPDIPFFRHPGRVRGTTKSCIIFGPRHLSDWWNRACDLLGIKGVPLYPGTKHTTATETAKLLGSDRAKNASGLTNKAFDRYCQVESSDAFEVVTEIRRKKKGEVIPIRRREEG